MTYYIQPDEFAVLVSEFQFAWNLADSRGLEGNRTRYALAQVLLSLGYELDF